VGEQRRLLVRLSELASTVAFGCFVRIHSSEWPTERSSPLIIQGSGAGPQSPPKTPVDCHRRTGPRGALLHMLLTVRPCNFGWEARLMVTAIAISGPVTTQI
jgi:hypothetical protein